MYFRCLLVLLLSFSLFSCQKAGDVALEKYNIITAPTEPRNLAMAERLVGLVKEFPSTAVTQKSLLTATDIFYSEAQYERVLELVAQVDQEQIAPELQQKLLLQEAVAKYHQDDHDSGAESFFRGLVKASAPAEILVVARDYLGRINYRDLFAKIPDERVVHTVVRGENMERISKKYGVTVPFVMRLNRITDPRTLTIGQRLTIVLQQFAVTIDTKANYMLVARNGQFFKQYRVATGTLDTTPLGDFYIQTKSVDPTWYWEGRKIPGGTPENALGSRWMGIENADRTTNGHYGIHGTNEPDSIGKSVSHGCVRMHNADVEELYDLLTLKTAVVIKG